MKILMAQLPIDRHNPSRNAGQAAALLQDRQSWSPDLIILPRNFITGPPPAHQRGWRAAGCAWRDFLALTRQHPGLLWATSSLNFDPGPHNGQETGFIIQNGQALLVQPKIADALNTLELQPSLIAGGLRLALVVGPDIPLPRPPREAQVAIHLASDFYQGPGRPLGLARANHQPGTWLCRINTCGGQGSRIFTGGSFVINPEGLLAAQAPAFESSVIKLDLTSAAPAAPKPELEPLEALRLALVTGLRDYVAQVGFGQVILGLSGGLDSALCAVLAVQALGPGRVRGFTLPSPYNAPESAADAAHLARNLNIELGEITISDLLGLTLKELQPHLDPDSSREAISLMTENIQARLRAVLLMALANQGRRLLICTSNKSETAMGYGTLYGDLCGFLAPLGDVYKSRAYDLARHINRNGAVIPERIITKAPSAELKPGQTDQDFLPPYPLLDDILYRLVELGQSEEEVKAASPYKNEPDFAAAVDFAARQMVRAAFKTLQLPPCLIASPRPFKYDF